MKEGIAMHIGNSFSAASNLKVLMNISTNTVLPPDSHVIKRDSIGCEMYRDFVTLPVRTTSSLSNERYFFMG